MGDGACYCWIGFKLEARVQPELRDTRTYLYPPPMAPEQGAVIELTQKPRPRPGVQEPLCRPPRVGAFQSACVVEKHRRRTNVESDDRAIAFDGPLFLQALAPVCA